MPSDTYVIGRDAPCPELALMLVHAHVQLAERAGRTYRGWLPSLTEWGSYPLIYVTRECDVLCAECATRAYFDPEEDAGDPPVAVDPYYEGPDEQCANCYAAISSAYGDPWADSETS